VLWDDGNKIVNIADVLLTTAGATLRQQEKLFANLRIILQTFEANSYAFPGVLLILSYLKMFKENVYRHILTCNMKLQEVIDSIESLFPDDSNNVYNFSFLPTIALFLKLYINSPELLQNRHWTTLLDDKIKLKEVVTSKFDRSDDGSDLFQAIKNLDSEFGRLDLSLRYLSEKIDFIIPVNI
jgi:hypothetical protein